MDVDKCDAAATNETWHLINTNDEWIATQDPLKRFFTYSVFAMLSHYDSNDVYISSIHFWQFRWIQWISIVHQDCFGTRLIHSISAFIEIHLKSVLLRHYRFQLNRIIFSIKSMQNGYLSFIIIFCFCNGTNFINILSLANPCKSLPCEIHCVK